MTTLGHARSGFWRGYWITLRPYLFFVSGVSGLAGLAVPEGLPLPVLSVAFSAFFLTYGLGQALTDVFQIDTDSLSAPYRPLVRGEISRPAVLGVSFVGLAACATTFFLINPRTLWLSATGALALLGYTPLKRRWWAGPPWNAAIVALLPVIGFLCGGAALESVFADPDLPWVAGSVFCSYAVFVLLGYLKDVSADSTAGYDTLPVRFGRRAAVVASAGCGVLSLGCSAALLTRAGERASLLSVALLALAATWLVLAHERALRVVRDEQAHFAVACSVRGFLALHVAEAIGLRPELAWLGVPLLALFELSLSARPCERQI